MRKSLLFSIRVALLICVYPFFETCGVRAQTRDGADLFSGQIVWIEWKGALKIKQAKGMKPVDGAEGMLIRRGYLLTLAPRARAVVVCGDGRKLELTPGLQGCPCRKTCTVETCGIGYDASSIIRMGGPDTDQGLVPIVISPRKTMLRNLRPTIRWTPVNSAKESPAYRVSLYEEGRKHIWTREVASETTLPYPDNAPSLKPGKIYKVIVTSSRPTIQRHESPDLGFTTLRTDEERMLADEESKKRKMGLPERQTRLLISNLYAARELYSEAIEQLEALRATMKEAAIARMLGDLYTRIGLNREAEKRYVEALALTPESDLDGVALTERNLAQVYEHLGNYDRAIERLEEAIKAYRRLGKIALANSLDDDAQRLKRLRGGQR